CVYHPYWIILIIAAITVFFAFQVPKITIDPRIEIFLSEDNHVRKDWIENNEDFDAPLDIIVGFLSDDIFTATTLKKIRDFSSEVEAIPGVEEVSNILNVGTIIGSEAGLEVSPMTESLPETDEELAGFKRKVESWDFYQDFYITKDHSGSLVSIVMEDELETDDVIPVYYQLKKIAEKYQGPEQIFISGVPVVEALQGDYMLRDMKLLIPLVNILIVIALFLFFRNLRGVVLPLLTVTISTLWSVGLMALLKMPITHVTSTIPVVLVAVGSAYGIHVLENIISDTHNGYTGLKGIMHSLNRVSVPIVMAGVTTIAAFISLYTSEIVPMKHFGIISAFGILASLGTSLTLIPALLSILEGKKPYLPHLHTTKDLLGPVLHGISKLSLKHPVAIITISSLILAASIVAAFQIRSDLDAVKHFRPSSPIRAADEILNNKFGGTSMFNVVIKTGSPDDIKDPKVLHIIEDLQNRLSGIEGVGKAASIVDFIKKMNQEMHDGDAAYYTIPQSRELVAQYLLLYSFSGGGEELNRFVNYDYSNAQILLQMKSQSGSMSQGVLNSIDEYRRHELQDSRIEIMTTGISKLSMEFNRIIVEGQINTFGVSLILVIIITTVIFRSFKLGFLSIVPLTVTIMLNFGIMGFFDITLNAATAMIASLTVGIGVDYSIHFLSRYRHELGLIRNNTHSLDISISTSGRAILYNALAVTAGFLVLTPSKFVIISQLGFLTALVMVTSSIASITLLPAVLKVFRPKIKKEIIANDSAI
ncbi:MAG: RND family transporter, partial [Deltaproteobacteria bacterium]|nr:RND family transporter [Deltaproteobacteria bacterium]